MTRKTHSSSPNPPRTVHLGVIGRPQGLAGEVRVRLDGIRPADIERLTTDRLFLTDPQGSPPRKITLTQSRFQKSIWIIKIAGIDNRTAAENLLHSSLAIHQADLWTTEPDEYYHFQLIGLEATHAATGEPLGQVAEVRDDGAQDQLLIRQPTGRTFLVPFTPKLVKEIDLETGRLKLDLPEGLIELNN